MFHYFQPMKPLPLSPTHTQWRTCNLLPVCLSSKSHCEHDDDDDDDEGHSGYDSKLVTGDIFHVWFVLQSNGPFSLVHRWLRVAACAALKHQSLISRVSRPESLFPLRLSPMALKHLHQRVEIQFPHTPRKTLLSGCFHPNRSVEERSDLFTLHPLQKEVFHTLGFSVTVPLCGLLASVWLWSDVSPLPACLSSCHDDQPHLLSASV